MVGLVGVADVVSAPVSARGLVFAVSGAEVGVLLFCFVTISVPTGVNTPFEDIFRGHLAGSFGTPLGGSAFTSRGGSAFEGGTWGSAFTSRRGSAFNSATLWGSAFDSSTWGSAFNSGTWGSTFGDSASWRGAALGATTVGGAPDLGAVARAAGGVARWDGLRLCTPKGEQGGTGQDEEARSAESLRAHGILICEG